MERLNLATICEMIDVDYQVKTHLKEVCVNKLSTPAEADETSLVFISNNHPQKQAFFNMTKAGTIICDESIMFTNEDLNVGARLVDKYIKVIEYLTLDPSATLQNKHFNLPAIQSLIGPDYI